MERRKKGSGQITRVEGRKSPWRASVVDSTGRQKSKFFKTEKEAKAFLREINADANKLKALLETGVSFREFSTIFLDEKSKQLGPFATSKREGSPVMNFFVTGFRSRPIELT